MHVIKDNFKKLIIVGSGLYFEVGYMLIQTKINSLMQRINFSELFAEKLLVKTLNDLRNKIKIIDITYRIITK